jgi:hypothetical protein
MSPSICDPPASVTAEVAKTAKGSATPRLTGVILAAHARTLHFLAEEEAEEEEEGEAGDQSQPI